MNLVENLEIIIITYNRASKLRSTLEQIFSDKSPVKNINITILDKKSDDKTCEIIKEYVERFPNLKHVVHKRNIGGNGNIARAFEYSSFKYLWVLCDDDDFDWDNWSEIEQAMESNHDIIYTCTELIRDKNNVGQLLHQATLVPACIYLTSRINDNIMQNIINTVNTMFSQVMLSADILINNKGRCYIPQKDILKRFLDPDETDSVITRGIDSGESHPSMALVFWHIGFIQAIRIIKDRKTREFVIENVNFNDKWNQSFFNYMLTVIEYNYKNKKNSFTNMFNLFVELSARQKIVFLSAYLYYFLFPILIYDEDEKILRLKFYNLFKTRIRFGKKKI